MKRMLLVAVSFLAWAIVPVGTQTPAAIVPELPFESVPDPLTLPPDIHFGEIAGVAVNSKGKIFVFSRGKKHQETISMTARMLARMCETGRMRAFENAYLIERATARARKQLAALKAAPTKH